MKTNLTRRDLLKIAGGSALGLFFTPLPWKLLDDSAIWTQNWSLTPSLSHGPITAKFSVCTLCPAGCSVAARCVDGIPFSLSGIPENPLDHGILCPRGLTGHHLAYHPLRITIPHKFSGKEPGSRLIPCTVDNAVKEITEAMRGADGSVVILNRNPLQSGTKVYAALTENLPKGIHAAFPSGEESTLRALQEMTGVKDITFGYDFSKAKMVVSFGAPILDGFGIPGEMTALYSSRKEKDIQFVQIESRQSRSALKADQWLAVHPGQEHVLALSIAYVLFDEKLVSLKRQFSIKDLSEFKRSAADKSPEATSPVTGIDAGVVRRLSRQLAAQSPSIILSGADPAGGPLPKETEKAIAALNILLGNIGGSEGIVPQDNFHSETVQWEKIPNHSISVLIIDSAETGYAMPWTVIEKKLRPKNNLVVALSPFIGESTAHADYIIPTTTYYESIQGVSSPSFAARKTFAVAQPLMIKPEGTIEETAFIAMLSSALNIRSEKFSHEELAKERTSSIFHSKKGTLFLFADKTTKPINTFSSADELYAALIEGAVWIDESKASFPAAHYTFTVGAITGKETEKSSSGNGAFLLMPFGWRGALSSSSVSPLLSKLFQESELRNLGATVLMNPKTLTAAGLSDSDTAVLETPNGSCLVKVRSTNTIPFNVIGAAVGPLPNNSPADDYLAHSTILSLCDVQPDSTWRTTYATIRKQSV